MSAIRPEEGDALTVAGVQGIYDALEDAVNEVQTSALIRRALRRDHVPGVVTAAYDYDVAGRRGLSTQGTTGGGGFNNTLFQSGAYQWQQFGSGGTKAPYGPAPSAEVGWRIVDNATASLDYAAERRFAARRFGAERLLVNFSADLLDIGADIQGETDDWTCVLVGIGIEDSLGNRFVVERSIRAFSRESFVFGDIGTFTILTNDDLTYFETLVQATPGTMQAVAVFAVVAAEVLLGSLMVIPGPGDPDPVGRPLAPGARLGNYNFDILPVPVGGL